MSISFGPVFYPRCRERHARAYTLPQHELDAHEGHMQINNGKLVPNQQKENAEVECIVELDYIFCVGGIYDESSSCTYYYSLHCYQTGGAGSGGGTGGGGVDYENPNPGDNGDEPDPNHDGGSGTGGGGSDDSGDDDTDDGGVTTIPVLPEESLEIQNKIDDPCASLIFAQLQLLLWIMICPLMFPIPIM